MPVGSNQQAFFNHESIESYELFPSLSSIEAKFQL